MTIGEEASRSVQAAWGLLKRDPGAAAAFNVTSDGVWRSFAAAAVLLPLELAYLAYAGTPGAEEAPAGLRWVINVLIFVIGWAGWPLAAIYLTRALGCGERALSYIVAYNWSQLLASPFIIVVAVLADAWFTTDAAIVMGQFALGAVLFYQYLVARQMLATSIANAVIVVLVYFAFALMLQQMALLALGAGTPGAGAEIDTTFFSPSAAPAE